MIENVNFTELIRKLVFPVFLVLVFLIDFVYKLLILSGDRDIRIVAYFKFIIITIMCFYLTYKKKYFILVGSLVLFLIWLIGQFTLENNTEPLNALIYFGKYIFPLFLFASINEIITTKEEVGVLKISFEILIIINSIIIIIGFIFDINLFQSYLQGNRFGYNGLILSSSQASYIYIIAICVFLYGMKWVTSTINFVKVLIVLCAALLIGTKAIYVFITFVFFITALKFFNKSFSFFLFIASLLGLFIVLLSTDSFYTVVERTDVITTLLSYRNELLLNRLMPYIQENWKIINYAFGGVVDVRTKSQLGFVDLIYFFGILGSIIYIYLYKKLFISFKLNLYNKVLLFGLCTVICFSGNFFYNPSLAIYIIVLQKVLVQNTFLNIQK